jgi:hypothetical protein
MTGQGLHPCRCEPQRNRTEQSRPNGLDANQRKFQSRGANLTAHNMSSTSGTVFNVLKAPGVAASVHGRGLGSTPLLRTPSHDNTGPDFYPSPGYSRSPNSEYDDRIGLGHVLHRLAPRFDLRATPRCLNRNQVFYLPRLVPSMGSIPPDPSWFSKVGTGREARSQQEPPRVLFEGMGTVTIVDITRLTVAGARSAIQTNSIACTP